MLILYAHDATRSPTTTPKYIQNIEYNTLNSGFRDEFPYFYDACLVDECANKENNSFIGYIYPSEAEREDKASRTELYLCGKCGGQHRFPRFSIVLKVIFRN